MNLRAALWSAEQAQRSSAFGRLAKFVRRTKRNCAIACSALQNASHRRGTRGDIREAL